MEKLISFDEAQYNNHVSMIENELPLVSDVINAYHVLNLSPLQPGELQPLFNDTVSFVFDKLTNGQPVSIAGLEVHKDKAMEILKKPEGYEALLNAVQIATESLHEIYMGARLINVSNISDEIEIDAKGNIKIKKSKLEKLKRQYQVYAKTDTAKKLLAYAEFILAKGKELNLLDYGKRNPNGFGRFISEIISGGDGKEPAINVEGILRYNNQ